MIAAAYVGLQLCRDSGLPESTTFQELFNVKCVRFLFIVFAAITVNSCTNSEYGTDEDYPGPKGEPPKALKAAYRKQFIAEQKSYLLAVGEIHSFLLANKYHPLYRECLTDVLDIRVTANTYKHEAAFPCVVVSASKGDGPPEVYISFTVNEVLFNQFDGNNRLVFTVGIYGYAKKDLTDNFLAR